MNDPAIRSYRSPSRERQARQTRSDIVSAAGALFLRNGFARTTVDAIAEAAGVNRKTVFTTVGGKAELLKLVIDRATVGDDEPVDLAGRLDVKNIARLTDPHAILEAYVNVVVDIDVRLAALTRVLLVAASIDEQARELRDSAVRQRLSGAGSFIAYLRDSGVLRDGLDPGVATDVAWLYSDPILYHRLVIERGWPDRQFRGWLLRSLAAQLLN